MCHICCKHFLFSVVVDAAPLTFQFYSGGIYDDSNCRTNSLNHAMLLVGYGRDEDTGCKYWILKNRSDPPPLIHTTISSFSTVGVVIGEWMGTCSYLATTTIYVALLLQRHTLY